ncbi:MAG: DUF4349 domain-containing protein [Bacillus sp. (in: Bacteria)]|nr:DUF4349 domain-containing protein [Bacillus sp. (in: firmicutes)]
MEEKSFWSYFLDKFSATVSAFGVFGLIGTFWSTKSFKDLLVPFLVFLVIFLVIAVRKFYVDLKKVMKKLKIY